ncbi:hypothetical protein PMO01_02190 [Pseudomonas moraviensis R28-S]|uniref:Uncharacterized protein n=1 Tax=Pseudomonas moraviensis R28-S TaxID=1395516 RepID=V8REP9_9PSED|nr:hypothetical protein PMO01_02190 [Pseudomonas moraviensis R28-S]
MNIRHGLALVHDKLFMHQNLPESPRLLKDQARADSYFLQIARLARRLL